MLQFDFENKCIKDTRDLSRSIFCGEDLSVAYTLVSDDITKGKKPFLSPYSERYDSFSFDNGALFGKDTGSELLVSPFLGGVILSLKKTNENISEFGLHFPLNMLGKLGGGGREDQFLPNACFVSEYSYIKYWYFARQSGNNIVVCALTEMDGFRNLYSAYDYGHYITGINFYADFDKALKTSGERGCFKLAVLPVKDFDDCLSTLSNVYGLPFLSYDIGGGFVGDSIKLRAFGKVDEIKAFIGGKETAVRFDGDYQLSGEGETVLVPYSQGKAGAEISVFAFGDYLSIYKKAMMAIGDNAGDYLDGNLCEHQNWLNATLKLLNRFKYSLCAEEIKTLEERALRTLNVITETDGDKAAKRRTILSAPHDGLPAYNVFKSTRVQELFCGISILIEAYKYFKDEKYYDYVIGAMDCFLGYYQQKDGSIRRFCGGEWKDYSSVCAPLITMVEAANVAKCEGKSALYLNGAKKLAEYIYRRGLDFPTEGENTPYAQPEIEEGSMSCSALQLLYYVKNVEFNEDYLRLAKSILDIHDNYIIKTPLAAASGSTLRWWETIWEGDGDGPAICNGHAWTIWRAEADYLYYSITGDDEYRKKAFNGFLSNLAKINERGENVAIRQTDMITGGGECEDSESVLHRIAPKWPDKKDYGLSSYVFVRLCETFLDK